MDTKVKKKKVKGESASQLSEVASLLSGKLLFKEKVEHAKSYLKKAYFVK